MHPVIIADIEVVQALWLKDQLIRDGLIMHDDFEWEWNPPMWDGFTQERGRHVTFRFRDPALATFYQLKWL